MNEEHQIQAGAGAPAKARVRAGASMLPRQPAAVLLIALLAAAALPRPASAGDLAGPELRDGGPGATIAQNGNLNHALIEQRGPIQFAHARQDGMENRLAIWQGGGIGNVVNAIQAGEYNEAVITQIGHWNEVYFDQNGSGNVANITQYGVGRQARIEQYGVDNRIELVQGANAPNVMLRQAGQREVVTLVQH